MGGNAIKDNNGESICGRVNIDEYRKIKEYLLTIISKYYICQGVKELPYKTNFGDIDIIYISNPELNIKDIIQKEFNVISDHIVTNGNVLSFAYMIEPNKYFQVDLIKCKSNEHLIMSDFFLSYADIGSIIGRITFYYSLKFGDKGLWCDFYESSIDKYLNNINDSNFDVRHNIGKVYLCNEPIKICEYLDLDYNVWLNIFPNIKENEDYIIYDWIIKSKLFKKEIFYSLNHFHRKRKNMRQFYSNFIKYIEVEEISKVTKSNGETGGIKYDKQLEAIKYFNKEDELMIIINEYKLNKDRSNKFNGRDLIDKFSHIHHIEFSKLIQKFKDYCVIQTKSDNWNNFVDKYSREDILSYVELFNL